MSEKVKDYSIGVVTYVARYESYLKPIIHQLVAAFPDKEIVCVVNGHPNKTLQNEYLRHITKFLSQFPNVRYMAYEDHQPLAKCWNRLLLMTFAERMLILNDDLKLDLFFRQEFEKKLQATDEELFVLNNSWSNFLISKKTIKELGWFEERLLGCGDEDADYTFRYENATGKKLLRLDCYGVINYVAPQTNAGWQTFSSESEKRAKYNEDFIKTKWQTFNDETGHLKGVLNAQMDTPLFYEYECLEDKNFTRKDLDLSFKGKVSWTARLKLLYDIPYGILRKKAGKIIRKILK